MTPNNIVNMSLLKGLDVISVTDHNSALNVPAIMNLGKRKGILVIPGMEVQTKEEVHILCYFHTLEGCMEFQSIWSQSLPSIQNRPDYFGDQLIMDESDDVVGEETNLLLTSSSYNVKDVFEMMGDYGVAVFAHVDRSSYSVISNLGFIPDMSGVNTIEVSKGTSSKDFLTKFPYCAKYRILQSSDAHYLGDIMERENFLTARNREISDILYLFKCVV
jgi:predicted metal-dependent phosphoesterase TrpH